MKRKKISFKSFKKMVSLLDKEKKIYIIASILRIIGIILSIYGTVLVGKVVDIITNARFEEINGAIFKIIIFNLLEILFTTSGILFIAKAVQRVMFFLRQKLNRNLQKMPVKKFEDSKTGELISIFINDFPKISLALDQSFAEIILSVIRIIFTASVILYFNIILGLITFVVIFLVIFFVFKIGLIIKKYSKKKMEASAKVTSYTDEIVSNEHFIKLYDYEKVALKKFNKKTDELKKYNITTMIYSNLLNFLSAGGVNVLMALSIFLGSYFAFNGILTVGALTIIIRLVGNLSMPINTLASQGSNLYEGLSSSDRVFDTLDIKKEIDDGYICIKDGFWFNPKTDEKRKINGCLEFKNVGYSYTNNKENFSLKNINFKIDKNMTMAIIGKTGAGKSTVSNLIARFYEINEGNIYIDGINIKYIRKKDLRSIISMVIQDINLFTGTVLDNIKYGNTNITKEEVEIIIKKLGIDNITKDLNAEIKTEENNMSEGEKQIISILRSAVSNPKILILDEATSKIDTVTEKNIQKGIEELKKDKINIIIAHRLSTIKNADIIMILNNGEIEEIGSPKELIEKRGSYYYLVTNNNDDLDLK